MYACLSVTWVFNVQHRGNQEDLILISKTSITGPGKQKEEGTQALLLLFKGLPSSIFFSMPPSSPHCCEHWPTWELPFWVTSTQEWCVSQKCSFNFLSLILLCTLSSRLFMGRPQLGHFEFLALESCNSFPQKEGKSWLGAGPILPLSTMHLGTHMHTYPPTSMAEILSMIHYNILFSFGFHGMLKLKSSPEDNPPPNVWLPLKHHCQRLIKLVWSSGDSPIPLLFEKLLNIWEWYFVSVSFL